MYIYMCVCVFRRMCVKIPVSLSLFYRGLASENPDLVQLKSLLAGLTLPVKTGSSDVTAEDRDGNASVISKPDENQMTHF